MDLLILGVSLLSGIVVFLVVIWMAIDLDIWWIND